MGEESDSEPRERFTGAAPPDGRELAESQRVSLLYLTKEKLDEKSGFLVDLAQKWHDPTRRDPETSDGYLFCSSRVPKSVIRETES